jgi:hypothetical protein
MISERAVASGKVLGKMYIVGGSHVWRGAG